MATTINTKALSDRVAQLKLARAEQESEKALPSVPLAQPPLSKKGAMDLREQAAIEYDERVVRFMDNKGAGMGEAGSPRARLLETQSPYQQSARDAFKEEPTYAKIHQIHAMASAQYVCGGGEGGAGEGRGLMTAIPPHPPPPHTPPHDLTPLNRYAAHDASQPPQDDVVRRVDPHTGRPYWYDLRSGKSDWKPPPGWREPAERAPVSPRAPTTTARRSMQSPRERAVMNRTLASKLKQGQAEHQISVKVARCSQ